jgi:uncharacterized membrane protein YczE
MTPTDPVQRNARLVDLGPLEQLKAGRMPRRLLQLVVGLAIYGASMAMVIRGALGAIPWDVLHTGLIEHIPITFGQMSILLAFTVLLMWIPLRQMPGLGTIANVLLVGLAADIALALFPLTDGIGASLALMLGGIALNAMATAMYIGSQLGPGPRDGLMTGLARISGHSIRLVRTSIEVFVVAAGAMLGGSVGFGTVLYALAIGPLVHWMLPWFIVELQEPNPPLDESSSRL